MPRKPKEEFRGSPEWMLTFGDMNTLLLTFFVFLLTTMVPDVTRFNLIISAFQDAVGVLEQGRTINLTREELMNMGQRPERLGEAQEIVRPRQVEEMILGWLEELKSEERVQTVVTERGVTIQLTDSALFSPGGAEISPSASSLLARIAGFLRGVGDGAEIRVEGFTDDRPLEGGRFLSNIELSAARAANVFHVLEEDGVERTRMSVAGYGELRPLERLDEETDEEWRARNRRVEIAVLWDESEVR